MLDADGRGLLAGRVAIITGGTGGVGEATARRFIAEGAQVVLGDLDLERGAALAAELGTTARFVAQDVTSEHDWERIAETTLTEFGRLDILVNNAGVYAGKPFAETSLEEFMAVVLVNQVGTFLGIRTAAPIMRDAGGGSIVNISSIAGARGGPAKAGYGASKWAVRGLTKVAAAEFGPHGVRVNAVLPGGLDTAMLDTVPGGEIFRTNPKALTPLGRVGLPRDVANLVTWLASDEADYVTGADYVIDGGALSA